MNNPIPHPRAQEGAVLIVSLVFLLLFTVIGLATMQSTNLQASMANNVQDRMMAFEAAEAALRAGEQTIASYTSSPDRVDPAITGSKPGVGEVWATNTFQWSSVDWASDTIEYTATLDDVAKPHYAVEFSAALETDPNNLGMNPSYNPVKRYIYRVTAHATGLSQDTEVVLQSTTVTRLIK